MVFQQKSDVSWSGDRAMAEDRMAVLETVRKVIAEGDVDVLRESVRAG